MAGRVILSRYRLSLAVVLVGVLAGIATVAYGWVRYAPPNRNAGLLHVPKSPAANDGWTWSGTAPGWLPQEMSRDLREVNGNVWTNDLAGARAAARREGIDPQTVRVLRASRYAPRGGLVAIVAGSRSGRTCLGFVLPASPVSFTCPQRQVAFVVVTARTPSDTKPTWPTLKSEHLFPLFLDGVVRGDVTRVVVVGSVTQEVYARSQYFWGTFTDTPGDGYLVGRVPSRDPWRARIDFYGAHGRLASLRIRLNAPGYRLFTVR